MVPPPAPVPAVSPPRGIASLPNPYAMDDGGPGTRPSPAAQAAVLPAGSAAALVFSGAAAHADELPDAAARGTR